MFVKVKRYLTDWKGQREINDSLKEINASQNEAISALLRRVEALERQGYAPKGGGPGGETPAVWFGGGPDYTTKGGCGGGNDAVGGLRYSEEHGGYIGPGGGVKRVQDIVRGSADYSSDSCGGVGIGNKVIE